MTENEKKRIGKAKVGLIICAILVVILAISNIWFFMRTVSLQNQVNTLETDKSSLQSQVSSLEADKSNLESEVSSLQSQVDSLNPQIANLTAIINMEMSTVWVNNETLTYPPNSDKTWGAASVNYAGLVLVRVETPLLEGYAGSILAEIKVALSTVDYKPYISQEGTLNLDRTSPENRIKTALFPVADLTFPLRFYIRVTNVSSDTVQLTVTITYVY